MEKLIVSGTCCWWLRLLRRFFRSDQLLSIFVGPELQRSYFFESNLASSWAPPVVTLKFRSWSSPLLKSKSICFSSDRTLREALFLLTLANHFVSISSSVKKTMETFLEAVLPRKAPNNGSKPWSPDRNKLLSKKGRAGWNGFQFSRF